jgi:hypothetical protein
MIVKRTSKFVPMQFDRGTRILRVISRAGRPCHFRKVHQYQQMCNAVPGPFISTAALAR